MISIFNPAYTDKIWDRIWSVLYRAFKHSNGAISEEMVYNGIKSGEMQLWLEVEDNEITGASVALMDDWNGKPICLVLGYASDNSDTIADFQSAMESWARKWNAAEMISYIRPGLESHMRTLGYKRTHIQVVKVLGE